MRLRQLENFIAVCNLGSISQAAERMHVAQPALGLQVRGLEDEMGAQLLERHARGVRPTPAGLLVVEWATQTVANAKALKQQLGVAASGLAGSLTLGLTPSVAAAFALPILQEVQRALPNLRLHLTEALGHLLRDGVKAGRVDLALVFDSLGSSPSGAGKLLTESLYFVTASGSPQAQGGSIALAEALEHPLAIAGAGDSLRMAAEHAAKSLDLPLDVEYEIQSVNVILKLVRSKLASTILPMPMVMDHLRAGDLVARRIESPALTRDLHWLASANAAPAAAALQGLVERVMQNQRSDPLLNEAYEMAAIV
ncbi:MAG: hypothetical protein JWQ07_4731 [Ramlibacter sp.]|nr:hypothetical protein [Ramlibacter sp.]